MSKHLVCKKKGIQYNNTKMFNFDYITKKDIKEQNLN